jgi:hypothetical protein
MRVLVNGVELFARRFGAVRTFLTAAPSATQP